MYVGDISYVSTRENCIKDKLGVMVLHPGPSVTFSFGFGGRVDEEGFLGGGGGGGVREGCGVVVECFCGCGLEVRFIYIGVGLIVWDR